MAGESNLKSLVDNSLGHYEALCNLERDIIVLRGAIFFCFSLY